MGLEAFEAFQVKRRFANPTRSNSLTTSQRKRAGSLASKDTGP